MSELQELADINAMMVRDYMDVARHFEAGAVALEKAALNEPDTAARHWYYLGKAHALVQVAFFLRVQADTQLSAFERQFRVHQFVRQLFGDEET